jgi:hypothetical protein
MRRSSLLAALVWTLQIISAVNPSVAKAEVVAIDFEEASNPSAIEGTDASTLYERVGVTFETHPSIYQAGALAHSGTLALRNLSPGVEFGGDHLLIDFDPACDVGSVSFFAGLDPYTPVGPVNITAEAFALAEPSPAFGVPVIVASQTETLTGPGPTPISTPFLVAQPDKEGNPIIQVRVSYSGINTALIDDLSFDANQACGDTGLLAPPTVSLLEPTDDQTFETVAPRGGFPRAALVTFRIEVRSLDHINRVLVTETGPSGTRSFDACGAANPCPSIPPSFDFTLEWVRDYTVAGDYHVTAEAFGDASGRSVPTTVDFRIVLYRLPFVGRGTEIVFGGPMVVHQPTVDEFAVMIEVPAERELRSVVLELNDTSIPSGDTQVALFPVADVPGIRLEPMPSLPHFAAYRVAFALPLWQPGWNHVTVSVETSATSGATTARRSTAFRYDLPAENFGIGIGPDGRFGTQFRLDPVPIWASDCPFVFCKDADQDRLLDLWENLAIEVLHPTLMLGSDDELFEEPTHTVRLFTRTIPVQDGGRNYVLFLSSVAFSADYGDPVLGLESHHGDTEEFDMLWRIVDSGRIVLDRSWTKGHTGFVPSPEEMQWGPDASTFDRLGRLGMFIETDKHGTWPSFERCYSFSFYYCLGNAPRRYPAVNVGEPPEAGRPFIDSLSLAEHEPHPSFFGIFPGEFVWSTPPWGPKFCGGLGYDGTCAGHIGQQLRERCCHGFGPTLDDAAELITPGRP